MKGGKKERILERGRGHLLIGDEGEEGIVGHAGDGEAATVAGAPADEEAEHSFDLFGIDPATPLLEVDLLPAVRAGNGPAP